MSNSHSPAEKSSTTPHDNTSNVSNDDFKTMMKKKQNELNPL